MNNTTVFMCMYAWMYRHVQIHGRLQYIFVFFILLHFFFFLFTFLKYLFLLPHMCIFYVFHLMTITAIAIPPG